MASKKGRTRTYFIGKHNYSILTLMFIRLCAREAANTLYLSKILKERSNTCTAMFNRLIEKWGIKKEDAPMKMIRACQKFEEKYAENIEHIFRFNKIALPEGDISLAGVDF